MRGINFIKSIPSTQFGNKMILQAHVIIVVQRSMLQVIAAVREPEGLYTE